MFELDIDFEDFGFGDIICFIWNYQYLGEKLFFYYKMIMFYIQSVEVVIVYYSVKRYFGREFFIYVILGGVIDIIWK